MTGRFQGRSLRSRVRKWKVQNNMPPVFIVLSFLGLVFFGVRLVTDPESWAIDALGIAACLFLGARNLTVMRSDRRIASSPLLHEVLDQATLEEALASERAILYKHSTRCPVSAVAIDDVLRVTGTHPEWRGYLLKVLEHRDLSDSVAEQLGVPHESPQVFVLKQGRILWHTSHGGITVHSLSRQLA